MGAKPTRRPGGKPPKRVKRTIVLDDEDSLSLDVYALKTGQTASAVCTALIRERCRVYWIAGRGGAETVGEAPAA